MALKSIIKVYGFIYLFMFVKCPYSLCDTKLVDTQNYIHFFKNDADIVHMLYTHITFGILSCVRLKHNFFTRYYYGSR